MLDKIISLSIRVGVACGVGFIVGITVHNVVGNDISVFLASIIWFVGGIYSLYNFNNPYNFVFVAVKNAENKVAEILDNKNKQKIEEEMLRVKNLRDNDILTEDEYNRKMKSLKDKYF